ncbi:hypothetical protein AAFC00_000015 [Neodothiora populina]|uniref:histidine kinase n=1 Tax=Neodothiora populina TaxID=2781224 RepID=A0ABR3P138_9PEZI
MDASRGARPAQGPSSSVASPSLASIDGEDKKKAERVQAIDHQPDQDGKEENNDDDDDDDDEDDADYPAQHRNRRHRQAPSVRSEAYRHSEVMRVREVFRYLEPWESNIRPTLIAKAPDGSDPAPLEPASDWTPIGCEDTALAAFAQLGAMRLNAQRCMISLVSKDQEIILAESTRTLSLQSDEVHSKEDALWLGTTSFPREEGMSCLGLGRWKKTTKTRPSPSEDDFYYTDGISKHWHIISDMRQQTALHNRLFVRCAKNLRFYASVPIRTPSGSVIGSYAVFDERPRFGISAREMEFMEDIADTVMGHLEAKRAMVQRQRGDRLVKGVALFNGGKSSLREWWMANYSRNQRGEGKRRRRGSTSEEELKKERADEEFGQTYRKEHLDARGRLIPGSSSTSPVRQDGEGHTLEASDAEPREGHAASDAEPIDQQRQDVLPTSVDIAADTIASTQSPSKKTEAFDLPKEINSVFARASNLIRESLSSEGVILVDLDFPRSRRQRRGRYEKSERHRNVSATEGETDSSLSSSSLTTDQGADDTAPSHRSTSEHEAEDASSSTCKVLGFSTKIKSSVRGFQASQRQRQIPTSLMNRLLRRYPHGKIFNYHNGRALSSSSAGEGTTSTAGSAADGMVAPPSAVPKAKAKSKEAQDAAALAEFTAEPRSIAFLPLWDDRRDRWRTGVLVWNVAPNRFLDLEEDVTYLAAFGNSLMAELARLEVMAADTAKATFISSVSHELRSPLHGVLAGVEFLQESKLDTYQREMATTINMAGRTLLDTINNILDFTKINSFTDSQRDDRKSRDLTRHMSFKSADVGEVGVTSNVDLAELTENVVNTLVTANQFRASVTKKSLQSTRRSSTASGLSNLSLPRSIDLDEPDIPITVVLDIASAPSWHLKTSPGSWTRIITNLLGNAFKYTKSGTITVSLKAAEGKSRRDGTTKISLTIEDTGQGISEDFQKHHLWTPFMQENTHAVGTGLGLSIVRQVVQDVGGQIHVDSEVGRGTKVKVSLDAQLREYDATNNEDDFNVDIEGPRRARIAFLGNAGKSEQGRRDQRMRSVVSKTCQDWMDCSIETLDGSVETSSANVCVMLESEFEQWCQAKRMRGDGPVEKRSYGPPILVLTPAADLQQRTESLRVFDNVLFVNQPYGPRKLARAMNAVLRKRKRDDTRQPRSPRGHRGDAQKQIKDRSQTSTPDSSMSTTAESSPDREGSEERVSSPEHVSPIRETSEPRSPNPSAGRILLVEDNTVNMKLLIATMKKLGRAFQTAENGLEAVQQYASSPSAFVLILMDMSMPIMDGFTATETIRVLEEKNRWRRCMIVALTGVASAEARQRAFNAGVDVFLTKPASIQKLRGIVEELEGE